MLTNPVADTPVTVKLESLTAVAPPITPVPTTPVNNLRIVVVAAVTLPVALTDPKDMIGVVTPKDAVPYVPEPYIASLALYVNY